MLTGYGQWEDNVQANNTETSSDQAWTRLAFAGIKVGDYGSSTTVVTHGVLYDVEGWTDMLPEFWRRLHTYADNLWQAAPTALQPTVTAISSVLVEGLNFALQYQGKNEGQNAQDINVGTNITAAATARCSLRQWRWFRPLYFLRLPAWASARRRHTPHLTVLTIR
ncbi:porin [Klebsiella pneumoniae subsp. pneumoniae]|nr:porin [Klebsiella pneumoniae subsp. pneumoniae]